MRFTARLGIVISIAAALAACFGPHDRRPGLRLPGEVVAMPSGDWTFTNDHKEIAIEVHTPYFLPHSVTIWCAELEGRLYLGARDPESKRWPGWVDRNPNVRLRIGSEVFEVRLTPLEDSNRIAHVRQTYAAKYGLPRTPEGKAPPIRYWLVEGRS